MKTARSNSKPALRVTLALLFVALFAAPTAFAEDNVQVEWTDTSMEARGEIVGALQGTAIQPPETIEMTTAELSTAQSEAADNTPNPTYAFSTGATADTMISVGGSPADANVAASRTHICATARAAFACYTKSGSLVGLGAGFDARPYSAQEFFTLSGLPIGTAFDGSTSNVAKDGRVVFDAMRRRFFMDFQTRESKGRLMIAVSKSEDPRDGWWTYADLVATATANTQD